MHFLKMAISEQTVETAPALNSICKKFSGTIDKNIMIPEGVTLTAHLDISELGNQGRYTSLTQVVLDGRNVVIPQNSFEQQEKQDE